MKKIISILIIMLLFMMPIMVYADSEEEEELTQEELEEIREVSGKTIDLPSINSRAAIVIERNSKIPIFEKNAYDKKKMASTTKIMTSIIVVENKNLKETVVVSKKAGGTGGSRLGLKAGDKISVQDLLYGLMLCSGNDAAVALAEYVGENVEGFAKLMNEKAQELELENTHFVTPHGLDEEEHYTTAYELAILTDYALKIPEIATIVQTKRHTVTINNYTKEIGNTNELLGYLNGVYGVKTGFTNGANRCLVTAAKRDNLDIICVVLGADTKKYRTKDSIALMEYAFQNYETVSLKERIQEEFENWKLKNRKRIMIIKGKEKYPLSELDNIPYPVYPLKKGQKDKVEIKIENLETIEAPIEKGYLIGKMKINLEENELFKINIVTGEFIEKKEVWDYFKQLMKMITGEALLELNKRANVTIHSRMVSF